MMQQLTDMCKFLYPGELIVPVRPIIALFHVRRFPAMELCCLKTLQYDSIFNFCILA